MAKSTCRMREVKKERLDVVHWANERVEEERGEGGDMWRRKEMGRRKERRSRRRKERRRKERRRKERRRRMR